MAWAVRGKAGRGGEGRVSTHCKVCGPGEVEGVNRRTGCLARGQ